MPIRVELGCWLARACAAAWLLTVCSASAESAREPAEGNAVPEFSPTGGVYAEKASVELSAKSGQVRYTTDGSEPSEKSAVYSKPIELRRPARLKARVFLPGHPPGPVRSQTYVVTDKELEKFTSNLPLVVLNTFGATIDRHTKMSATACFIDLRQGRAALTGPVDFAGPGELHYRGKSSLRYLKRSYALKILDDAGQARKVPALGFPAENDWVLYAPYPDKTLMRDVLAYEMFNQMGHYTTRTKFVEVFVNESGGRLTARDYMGVFVLEEKIKRGKDRVNIQKLSPNDNSEPNITGGYVFKKDHHARMEEVTPTVDGWPTMGGTTGLSYGYPTGPGGFPGDPRGFGLSRGFRPEKTPSVRYATPSPGWESRVVILSNGTPVVLQRSPAVPTPGPPPNATKPGLAQRIVEWFTPSPPRMSTQPIQPAPPVQYWENRSPGLGEGESGEQFFFTRQQNQFFYVEPKQEEITPAQKRWLLNYLNEFERVLYGPDFKDPVKGYAAYLDVNSFIDQHLIIEVTKNIDGFRFSTFFTKDRGGKIRMEPIWDWNLSFGNANGKQGWLTEYWYWPQLDDQQYTWFRRLFEDPDFGQRYVDRWGQLRLTVFAAANLHARIDALATLLDEAQRRNFARWPILGMKVWPNYYVGQTYQDEVRWMKQWIARRLAWIDRQFAAAPVFQTDAGGSITLQAPEGTIYYTLDGSDPRVTGGGVSANARVYSGPIKVTAGSRLFARVKLDDRWSPPATNQGS